MKTITIDGVEYNLVPTVKQPEKWDPERVLPNKHYYYISSDGEILRITERKAVVDDLRLQMGNYFHSKEHALESRTQVRSLLRLKAYVREFAPDYEPDWNDLKEFKFYVTYNDNKLAWQCGHSQATSVPNAVYMPKYVAEGLVLKLNSGEVTL